MLSLKKIVQNVKYALHLICLIKFLKSMKRLLPNRFKRYGLFMAPLGFGLWLSMQLGLTKKILLFFLSNGHAAIHPINAIVAIASFFSFVMGMYFLAFSKEKVEDEMVQRTRLDSFQFAAFVQIICVIVGFIFMGLYKEPGEERLMLFFIVLLFIFWLSFIGRFNYTIHIRIKQLNAKHLES